MKKLIVIFKVFCIANKRRCYQRKHFFANDDGIKSRMILMKPASNLHLKLTDRAS
jgi:hypothetical protein